MKLFLASYFFLLPLADAFGLIADRQPPAAFGAARCDHAAATLRAHPCQEPMLALARNTLRLICALDHPVTTLSSSLSIQGTLVQLMPPLYVMPSGVSNKLSYMSAEC